MKSRLNILTIGIILFSCNTQNHKADNLSIIGTWKLLSGITIQKEDTTYSNYTKNQHAIKIINNSHFSFFRHDLGKDSIAIFVSGGGKYSLKGSEYKEHLEFCNYREWEGHQFNFTITVSNDTLTQKGIEKIEGLGIDRVIIEKYIKLN